MLDVDVTLEETDKNIILVGGPVTNLLVSEINAHLPVKFSDKKPWGIMSTRTNRKYTDETTGIIAKIENPFYKDKSIVVVAGISAVGTKAAVLALTRSYDSLLENYMGQKSYGAIVNGFDLDGDGRIDSIEILE